MVEVNPKRLTTCGAKAHRQSLRLITCQLGCDRPIGPSPVMLRLTTLNALERYRETIHSFCIQALRRSGAAAESFQLDIIDMGLAAGSAAQSKTPVFSRKYAAAIISARYPRS